MSRQSHLSARMERIPAFTDAYDDGTPDLLRLADRRDQQSFRHSFAALLDLQVRKQADGALDPEISDCAALLRFAYRESLRVHDERWAQTVGLASPDIPPSVNAYHFPNTAAGAGLFRTHGGSFRPQDLTDGTFTEFADADTLRRFNTHLIGRDVEAARTADLLFFRQSEQRSPYHSMAIIHAAADAVVVYHTGRDGKRPGEVRRVQLTELLRHPDARWRPVPENPNFLGVYRWNILREN